MWTLKEPVKIVLKKEGVIITRKTLDENQALADLVFNDPLNNARYGHNFKEGNYDPKAKVTPKQAGNTIEVNVKKKADLKEALKLEPSKPTALTSTEVQNDGMSLNVNEGKPELKSTGSQHLKPMQGNVSSKRKK